MAYGLQVFDQHGIEIVYGSRPAHVVKRVNVDGGVGTIYVPLHELPSGSNVTVVAGFVGGDNYTNFDTGTLGKKVLSSYSMSGDSLRMYFVENTSTQVPQKLQYTILVSRGNISMESGSGGSIGSMAIGE